MRTTPRKFLAWMFASAIALLICLAFVLIILDLHQGSFPRLAALTSVSTPLGQALVVAGAAAGVATVLVILLAATKGNLEFSALGVQFRGPSGPLLLWTVVFIAVAGVLLATLAAGGPTKEEQGALGERLDTIFGERNWFVYPGNPNQIGVTRVPAGLRIVEPIHEIDSAVGHFRLGEVVPEIVGANVTLSQVIGPSDIPSWQRGPLERWQAEAEEDQYSDGITQTRIDGIFGNATWKRNPEYEFSAIGTLTKNLPLAYPIVSVDSAGGKHGIGLPDIRAGQSVTIWFAERIREDL